MDALERLQEWYAEQCDGEWEHSYGVHLETLDNPGWSLTVDLTGTRWANLSEPRRLIERSENDWYDLELTSSKFAGNCGPRNLSELIREFHSMIERH
jgi:hypothetical protein